MLQHDQSASLFVPAVVVECREDPDQRHPVDARGDDGRGGGSDFARIQSIDFPPVDFQAPFEVENGSGNDVFQPGREIRERRDLRWSVSLGPSVVAAYLARIWSTESHDGHAAQSL